MKLKPRSQGPSTMVTKKLINFHFGLGDWWDEKLSKGQANYLRQHHEESFQAMKTIMDLVETEWTSKITRFPICIETHPFAQIPMRKYLLASEEEFEHMVRNNKDLIVLRITEAEEMHLTQQEQEWQ